MSTPIPAIFRLRRDLKTTWESVNPVLKLGEVGLEKDTRRLKFGNGATPWNSLPYGTASWSRVLDALSDVDVADGEAVYFIVDGEDISADTFATTMWSRGFMNAEDAGGARTALGLEDVLNAIAAQANAISDLDDRVSALENP